MPTKHTPGPWNRRHTGDGKRYIIGSAQSSWGTHVAEVYSDDTDADEAAANSVLVQSAPDLLEACEAIAGRDLAYFDGFVMAGQITIAEVQAIRAAVAKAKEPA